MVKEIDAETRDVWDFVTEVHVARFFEGLDLIIRCNFVEHGLERVTLERRVIHALEFAVDPQHGRIAGGHVQVGRFLFKHQIEKCIYFGHKFLSGAQLKLEPRQKLKMPPLNELIRREIAVTGVLPFSRFMELALYCPNYGYYQAKRDNPGRRGDFFTSVSVGELFGQLLAFQFAEWLDPEVGSRKSEARIIEAGAHDGTLAADILNWLQNSRPGLFEQIRYCLIEPSANRQRWQKEKLEKFGSHVFWHTGFEGLKLQTQKSKTAGIIFSNELLDAMPLHRFGWDAAEKQWFEWGVSVEGGRFIWARMAESCHVSSLICRVPRELESVLPHGYTVEASPAAENWWRQAADSLECGRLMTMDYGLTAEDLFSPNRRRGTLRAYFRHHLADDILANAGEQDLTAHVNFQTIQAAGESAGLKTEKFSTQSKFLTEILGRAMKDKSFGDWTRSRTRQFQTLTHPEHLGRSFRVLIQSKNLPEVHN